MTETTTTTSSAPSGGLLLAVVLGALAVGICIAPSWGQTSEDQAPGGAARPTVSFENESRIVREGAGTVSVDLVLSEPAPRALDLPIAVSGSASPGTDVEWPKGPPTIPAGATRVRVQLAIVPDRLDEDSETVVLELVETPELGLGERRRHTIAIMDDDPEPRVSFEIQARSVVESAGRVRVGIYLDAPSGRSVLVPFTSAGTAEEDVDFVLLAKSPVRIPPGLERVELEIDVRDDRLRESEERWMLFLGEPVNAELGDLTSHTLRIRDDDTPQDFRTGLGPALRIDSEPLAFGDVPVGRRSEPARIELVNTADTRVSIVRADLLGAGRRDFEVRLGDGRTTLEPGEVREAWVVFRPLAAGERDAVFYVRQDPPSARRPRLELSGTGLGPLAASPD